MTLKLDRISDRQVLAVRQFTSPVALVYRAHTEEDLVRQWMTGPEGWAMTECTWKAVVGGSFRVTWSHPEEGAFTQTGEFIALEANKRIEHVERYLTEAPGDTHIVTDFVATPTGTELRLTMTFDDPEGIEPMIEAGMAIGMEDSYARIDALLASISAGSS